MIDTSGELFVVPGAIDVQEVARSLGKLTLEIGMPSEALKFSVLDCFDQSLLRSGRLLLEAGGELHLWGISGQHYVQTAKRSGNFVSDFGAGPVREALSDFPALRALMEIGFGRFVTREMSVLDEWRKTLVRGRIIELSSDKGAANLVLLQRMRGYDRAFEKTRDGIAELAGVTDDISTVVSALFPDVEPYEAKPVIPLGNTEPAIQAANDIIRTYLSVARRNETGVIADIDTEFLHDYRVSLRKIRSVLSLFKGVYSDDQTKQLKQAFSDQMEPTGRMRDLDVYLLEKERYFSLLPEKLHSGLERMFVEFGKERAREYSKLKRRFNSSAYRDSISDLAAMFDEESVLSAGKNAELGAYDYACRLIWKRYRKVCKLARSITDTTPDDDVHDLRIECKKLRYLMEFFGPLFGRKEFKTIFKPLKKLQDNLGLFNDYSVQQDALSEFIKARDDRSGRADSELIMAVGGLIAVLHQQQRAERARVVSCFEHFDSPGIQRLFRTLFHKPED